MDLTYSSGDWFAVVLGDAVVVLPPTSDADTASRLYDAAQRDPSVDGLVQVLSRMLGAFGPLPPFAVLVREPGRTRVLLRGPVELTAGNETASGRGAERWAERSLPPDAPVELILDGRASGFRLPIAHGVVQCGWLGPSRRPRQHAAAPPAQHAAAPPAQHAAAPSGQQAAPPVPGHDAMATVPSELVPAPAPGPEPSVPAPAGPGPAWPDLGERPGDHDGLTLPADTEQDEAAEPAPVMEVSTGQRVELGRSTVVGRRPSGAAGGFPPDARMVAVPSPGHDISRNHVEVRVEAGRGTVRDLGSTNGTRLRRAGSTVRLVADQELPLRNGDVAELGEGIELRFSGLR